MVRGIAESEDLFFAIHALRCGGAKLERNEDGQYTIQPRITETSQWDGENEFDEDYQAIIEDEDLEEQVKSLLNTMSDKAG